MRLRAQRGFTLMETLLAVTLFVVVSAASFSIFSMGLQIWKRTRDISKSDRRVLLAMEKMGHDLRGMVRIAPKKEEFTIDDKKEFEYRGTANEIQIPAVLLPGEHPVMGGYGRITYRWDSSKSQLCRAVESANDMYDNRNLNCRPLAENIVKMGFRYWLPSGLEDSYSWYDTWSSEDGVPLAVEINIEMKSVNRYSMPKAYKKTVVIPVGGKYEEEAAAVPAPAPVPAA